MLFRSFRVSYDSTLCVLTATTPKMSCVAVNPNNTNGTIAVSWAEDSPALDNETILELTFQMNGNTPALLKLENATLRDNKGKTIENTAINGGKIGTSSSLQDPVAELVQTEHSIGIQATLYDAEFCGDVRTSTAQIILASYSNGKMSLISIPTDAVFFDQNGIAQISADVSYDQSISELQMFILDGEGEMTPLCEKVGFSI